MTDRMIEAVVIGVSAGGMKALSRLLPMLPSGYRFPVVIVQHSHFQSDDFLARYLNSQCSLTVKQANDGERIQPGTIYLAPPNHHLRICEDGRFALSGEQPVNFARPSIDVLFCSAVNVYGQRLIGLILTGAGSDGARGLAEIKKAGGVTLVQDPHTAEADMMPRSAISAVNVDWILPLDAIGKFLTKLSEGDI
jgi:two-component system, chemotaxis family, protein-glutamate methylesterase/glutaminase